MTCVIDLLACPFCGWRDAVCVRHSHPDWIEAHVEDHMNLHVEEMIR